MASTTRESWLASAQTFEADWWRTHWNDGRDPVPESRAIMERLGYGQDSFAGLRVLDVGCGPTRRLAWLRGMAQLDAIEPLAVKYDSLGDGTALSDYREVYAVPAEVAVPGLRNKYDFAFAINSLDHCYDLGASLDAIRSYLVLGGEGDAVDGLR